VNTLFALPSLIGLVITVALFVLQGWAFVDALTRRPDAFVAADKMTKQAWLLILGLALVAHLLFWNPGGILNLAGAVAAIVYLVDARPAMQSLTRG
jgi:cytochrome bd-type quinol oxidase subunit 2